MDMKGKRILLYVRVSTDEQARHGESILDQAQALHKWAEQHGCIIVGEYHDEGFSARKSYKSRPALSELLSAVERGEADAVVFTKLDRWFRNLKDYYKVQEILERHKVFWCATLEDYETQTSAGRFKVNLMLSIAEHEADQTSERIKFTFAQKRARGEIISGNMPRGYILKDGKPVKDPDTEAGMTAFWRTYLDTGRLSAAMDAAAVNGVPLRRYNSAMYMVNNVAHYAGSIQGVACDAYISAEDCQRIQQQTRRCPRKSDRVYLFRGLIFCGTCGGTFGAHQQNYVRQDGQRSAYYTCSRCSQTRKRECDNTKCIQEGRVEAELLERLEGAVKLCMIQAAQQQKQRRQARMNLAQLEAKRDRLTDAYIDGLINKDDYKRRLAKLEVALVPVPQPVRKTPEQLRALIPENWRVLYAELDTTHRAAFWRRAVEKISVMEDGQIQFEVAR